LFVYKDTQYCDDVFHVHVKIDQLVETGTPISDETYEPLYLAQMVYEQQLRGNAVEFLLVTIYFPKILQPREWFSTHLMA
jgi:hypothetical protein